MVCTGKVARDTKITVASINIHARIDKGAAGASMAAMLIFSARSHGAFQRFTEKHLHAHVLASLLPSKKKKILLRSK